MRPLPFAVQYMLPRPSIAVALLFALVASGISVRADGAIIALSPVLITGGAEIGVGSDQTRPSREQEDRETVTVSESALPADSSGMSAPASSSAPLGGPAAALASSIVLILDDSLSVRLSIEGKSELPEPHPSGLLRPPTVGIRSLLSVNL